MTPAEEVAAAKKRKRPKARKSKVPKNAIWSCTMAKFREDIGLSIRDVSIACKMSVAGLWRIEKGGDVMLSTAVALAAFFGTTIDKLWPAKTTEVEPCCECGEDYPRADLLAGEIYCPKCRATVRKDRGDQ